MTLGNLTWSAIAATLMATMGCTQPSLSTSTSSDASPILNASDSASKLAVDSGMKTDLPADEVILQAVLSQVESNDLCDGFYEPNVAQSDSQVYVRDNKALVEIACMRAAYQLIYAYTIYQPDGTIQPLMLDVFYPDETGEFQRFSGPTVGGLASFNPDQAMLTIFSKARGLGDCGSLAEYRWTANNLELETYRYKECDSSPEAFVEPSDYPQIYP